MKKITLLVMAFFLMHTNNTHAQKRRSGGQEGGLITVGASFLKFSKTPRRTGMLGGEFGYAHPIGEKNSIGGNVYFNTNTDVNDIKTNIVTFQPEFRNYFSDGAFSGSYLALNGQYQNQRIAFTNGTFSINNFGVGLAAGYNIGFTDRISGAIQAGFNYIIKSNQNTGVGLGTSQSSSQFIIGAGFGIRLE